MSWGCPKKNHSHETRNPCRLKENSLSPPCSFFFSRKGFLRCKLSSDPDEEKWLLTNGKHLFPGSSEKRYWKRKRILSDPRSWVSLLCDPTQPGGQRGPRAGRLHFSHRKSAGPPALLWQPRGHPGGTRPTEPVCPALCTFRGHVSVKQRPPSTEKEWFRSKRSEVDSFAHTDQTGWCFLTAMRRCFFAVQRFRKDFLLA